MDLYVTFDENKHTDIIDSENDIIFTHKTTTVNIVNGSTIVTWGYMLSFLMNHKFLINLLTSFCYVIYTQMLHT